MPLDAYSDLKTEVGNWMARSDLSGDAATFIKLAEARLNRELKPVVTDSTITGTQSSRRISISALSVVEPVALFLVPGSGTERQLAKRQDGTFEYGQDDGEPSVWAVDELNAYIDFDVPLDQAYSFRFRSKNRFALSDSVTTNWLLTNHSDVYLAACLMWSGGFVKDFAYAATFKAILDEGIPSVRNEIAAQNRATLSVDPGLIRAGGYSIYGDE